MQPNEHNPHRPDDVRARDEQMTLFAPGGQPRPQRPPAGRNARMALRLEQLADDWEDQADEARTAGDQVTERRMREQARDARRSAALLRAGPGGSSRLLAS